MFYDTETSGLWRSDLPFDHPSQPHLVQLGVQLFDANWVRTGIFTAYIRPDGWSIEPQAEAHHGISEARCARHGVDVRVALAALQGFAASAKQIVAHHQEFDRKVIKSALARVGADGLWWQRKAPAFFCTMEAATPILQLPGEFGFKYPSLEEAHRFFYPEKDFSTLHDAERDIDATVAVFKGLQSMGAANA